MKKFWFEKWLGNHIVFYFGNGCGVILGIVLGRSNYIYLFDFCIGIDFNY